MKTTLAMVCSLLLMGTPFLMAQTPLSCVKQVRACCQHGGEMPCCKESSSPDSQSKPVVPAQTSNQSQLSLLAANIVAWVLPDATVSQLSSTTPISFETKGSPFYARDCARLI